MVGMMIPMKREGETYFGLALAHHLCVKKTLTAKELAAATGISASFISQIASRARNASQENQVAIAEALGSSQSKMLMLGEYLARGNSDVIDITPELKRLPKEGKEDMGQDDGSLSVRILNDRVTDQRDRITSQQGDIDKMSAAIAELHAQFNNLHNQYNALKGDCERVISCLDEYRKTGNRECLERLGVEG